MTNLSRTAIMRETPFEQLSIAFKALAARLLTQNRVTNDRQTWRFQRQKLFRG